MMTPKEVAATIDMHGNIGFHGSYRSIVLSIGGRGTDLELLREQFGGRIINPVGGQRRDKWWGNRKESMAILEYALDHLEHLQVQAFIQIAYACTILPNTGGRGKKVPRAILTQRRSLRKELEEIKRP